MTSVEPDAATITRVKNLAGFAHRPALTEAEVVEAIQNHPRLDADGLPADAEDWTQTWDINAAVAELWGIKAGKVAGDFNFSADAARYDKGDVMAKCLEMEAHYASKSAGSIPIGAHVGDDLLGGVIVNG